MTPKILALQQHYSTLFFNISDLESVSFGERDTTVEPWSGEELKSPGLHLGFRGQPDYTDDDTDLDQNLGDTGFMEDEVCQNFKKGMVLK